MDPSGRESEPWYTAAPMMKNTPRDKATHGDRYTLIALLTMESTNVTVIVASIQNGFRLRSIVITKHSSAVCRKRRWWRASRSLRDSLFFSRRIVKCVRSPSGIPRSNLAMFPVPRNGRECSEITNESCEESPELGTSNHAWRGLRSERFPCSRKTSSDLPSSHVLNL